MDFSVQANATIFAHKNFHPVVEASFQGRKDGEGELGTAVKVSVVPTLVPTGELSAGARPHFKLIYSLAIYNEAARNQAMSGYLPRTRGAAAPQRGDHRVDDRPVHRRAHRLALQTARRSKPAPFRSSPTSGQRPGAAIAAPAATPYRCATARDLLRSEPGVVVYRPLGLVVVVRERARRAARLQELRERRQRVEIRGPSAPRRCRGGSCAGSPRSCRGGALASPRARAPAAPPRGPPGRPAPDETAPPAPQSGRGTGFSAWALSHASMKIRSRSLRNAGSSAPAPDRRTSTHP